jgi:pimeloyl-ACP methyl ester carboxylesterase
MARLTVNGASIAFVDEGRGDPPFVFIHGFACDHRFWQPQVDDLKRDHRCIAVDLRGRGGSEATPPFDLVTAADDVAAVMRELGLPPAIVVGHSLGGRVALLLNWRHPEAVCGIVMGDSPVGFPNPLDSGRMAKRLLDEGSMEPIRTMVEGFFVESTTHDVRELARGAMLTCPVEVAAGAFDREDVYATRMDEIIKEADKKPFMAIWAEKPLGDPGRLREITMFLRQEPIAGAGHFFQLEQPRITNALLRAFVDDVRRDPRLHSIEG